VRGTPGVLRTGATRLLSGIVQASVTGSSVRVRLSFDEAEPKAGFGFWPAGSSPGLSEGVSGARAAGLALQSVQLADGSRELQLSLPAALPRRVLVIEDNASAHDLYERYLDGTGWQVVSLADARQAAEVALSSRPNAILLDIMMPELDGWTVLQALRLDPNTRRIPVIICSVIHDPGLATALGASACLAKPVTRLELLAALRVSAG
jgi:CheY-like chemotaxis protein